jgi:hypothetical protein
MGPDQDIQLANIGRNTKKDLATIRGPRPDISIHPEDCLDIRNIKHIPP